MGKFTFEYYRDMLNNALMMGYEITSMKDYKKVYDKHILIRHDLDFTLENVPIFSTIENELGVSGTYFVRINAKNYNPFSHNNSKIIKSLIDKNHEIGLHIEPDFYKNMGLEYVDYINTLINLFEKTFKIEISGISTHEPARCGYIIDKKNITEIKVDYEAYIIDNFKYISDSGSRWREGDLNEWIGRENKIIVNTHPVWWYNNTPLENY
jgi:hypothetical protein